MEDISNHDYLFENQFNFDNFQFPSFPEMNLGFDDQIYHFHSTDYLQGMIYDWKSNVD
jgi:hypothetical protein